jgi:serine/threonine protein kinase
MPTSDERDPVDILAEEFAARLRRGEHPSVTEYAAAHPDLADELRELLPAVAQMEFLKRFRRATGHSDKESPLPDRFGDFRIIGELGRGGMGIVFEAVQESLGRPVALKVLSTHAQLDAVRRERFIREAQAAARLHHTNIVAVFGVGEQDGLPYYVMQLIRGQGLHTVIRRWRKQRKKNSATEHTTHIAPKTSNIRKAAAADTPPISNLPIPKQGDWSFVAEVGIQAAEALHYAHKQGVLHRDVKPANLILDPDGRVWVTDFGLAKLVEQEGLTASGDILGTLQYLPPECLAGEADPRSDVYGLGATLYELLTLVPPQPSDSPARLLKLIADTDPVPPRELNPDIPRDLETIVLKAMAREPTHRYASARDLARDLEAFLEDRPIQARRQSWLGRVWRLCRRNPVIALLSVNMVAALVLAGIVGWVGYVKTKRALQAEADQLQDANSARADAERANKQLEGNLRMCLNAFERVFEAAGGRPVFAGPGFPGGPGHAFGGPPGRPPPPPGSHDGQEAEDKAAILEAILAFFDNFAKQNATDPRLQLDAARAYRRIGESYHWRGNIERATSAFRHSAELLEDLHRKDPDDLNSRAELVRTYLDAPPEIFANYEQVLQRMLELSRVTDQSTRPHLYGSVLFKIGWVRDMAGNRLGAEAAYRDAITALTPRDRLDNRDPGVAAEQGGARLYLAVLLAETNRLPEARKVLDESVAEFWKYANQPHPGRPLPWELVALTYQYLADACDRLSDPVAASAARAEVAKVMGKQGGPHDVFGGFHGGPKKEPPPPKKEPPPPKKEFPPPKKDPPPPKH